MTDDMRKRPKEAERATTKRRKRSTKSAEPVGLGTAMRELLAGIEMTPEEAAKFEATIEELRRCQARPAQFEE